MRPASPSPEPQPHLDLEKWRARFPIMGRRARLFAAKRQRKAPALRVGGGSKERRRRTHENVGIALGSNLGVLLGLQLNCNLFVTECQ